MTTPWHIAQGPDPSPELWRAVGGHPVVARLLALRGLTDPSAAAAFLNPSLYHPAPPGELPGIETLCRLVRQAVAAGQHLRIWGDLDADGQTATALLTEALAALGARVDWALPRRGEGHGLPRSAVEQAAADGIDLLITCDTGIGDADNVSLAKRLGLQVAITDHHDLPPRLPSATAIVNPKMLPMGHPLRELSGVGVAYTVAQALLEGTASESLLEEMLDLVALGLVADVSLQTGDVRYLIQRGLGQLRRTRRPGLVAMSHQADIDLVHVDTTDIGYALAPRMNAAGRLADAADVVRLLLTRDPEEAEVLAGRLEALNRDRQARTDALLRQAVELLQREQAARQPIIVLEGQGWEPGILGPVAGALARAYGRPTVLIAHRPEQPSVASARSIPGFDIHEAIVAQGQHLLHEGGHPMAAGFAVERERVPHVRHGLLQWAERHPPPEPPPLQVDLLLPWEEVGLDLAREVARLAPFGPGNPTPLFMLQGGMLLRAEDVSRTQETPHRRLYIEGPGEHTLAFIWFNAGELPPLGESVDVTFHLHVDYYHGEARAQLELVAWREAAPREEPSAAPLVAGRQVIDWRTCPDWRERWHELVQTLGSNLVVWGEGMHISIEGALSRIELPHDAIAALAIATPPPDPDTLRRVLERTQPYTLYLLPGDGSDTPSADEFLRWVAGMVRVALSQHDGWIDLERMAARVAANRVTVMAALCVLEEKGLVALRFEAGRWRAYRPEEAPPKIPISRLPAAWLDVRANSVAEKPNDDPRGRLLYLLREMRAYRQTFAEAPVEFLLGTTR
ncbi:MAG: single-stranded-DNA-specific exonuclease RecJ [Chloroflexi bacterium]|nr:single-stranded-DNA-specific exonuclease RecJ [Chloroflexota bacterium]